MTQLLEYKCPNCSSAIRFDVASRTMCCDHCSSSFSPDEYYERTVDIESVSSVERDQLSETVSYICSSCGGEIVCEAHDVTAKCPFCLGEIVITDNVSGKFFPQLIVPFRFDKQRAENFLMNHLAEKGNFNRQFLKTVKIAGIKGLYIPMWVLSTSFCAETTCTASYFTHIDSAMEIGRASSLQKLSCKEQFNFTRVPFPCTKKVDSQLLKSIAPFDFSNSVSFDYSYLEGFYFYRYFSDHAEPEETFNNAITDYVSSLFRGALHEMAENYMDIRDLSNCKISKRTYRRSYGAFPVWLATVEYDNHTYNFVINGDNGIVGGDIPVKNQFNWLTFFKKENQLVKRELHGSKQLDITTYATYRGGRAFPSLHFSRYGR